MTTSGAGTPSATAIERAMKEFALQVDAQQVLKIQQYTRLLLAWNDKVNLTAIRDPLEILYRHFCESMYGATFLPVEKCRLADVGSGGGFPGLPLKILRPGWEVFLMESNVKKATFLAEVVREIGLNGAKVLVSRFEELGEEVAPLDVVCSRALGDFRPFLAWAASPQVAARQALLWIGGRDLEEVKSLPGWVWHPPKAMPHSIQRLLLLGSRSETGNPEAAPAV